MQRKTLTQRLTVKYKLIVRNEENFADRWSLRFNFAGLLVFLTLLLILFYASVTGLNKLGDYVFGADEGSEEMQQLFTLATTVDSLEYELDARDQYINNFKIMLDGGIASVKDTMPLNTQKNTEESKISEEEEEFLRKYEKEVSDPSYESIEGYSILYFTPPIIGDVTYVKDNGQISSVEVESSPKKTIKALDAGTVVNLFAGPDSTYSLSIQHKNGLLTQYSGLKTPLVKANTAVKKGTDIGAAGKQKIKFTMVYNGKLLNPRSYIAWK